MLTVSLPTPSSHPDLRVHALLQATAPLREQLDAHPIYAALETLEDVQRFMSHHVFAVWDFMSLLKSLQASVTCTTVPWRPVGDPAVRRLINEIVLEEESDEIAPGQYASHFEVYLEAMKDAGADRTGIEALFAAIARGSTVDGALNEPEVPSSAAAFVRCTWRHVEQSDHRTAATFAFAREFIIPGMFESVVAQLAGRHPGKLDGFLWYLRRHIDLDGGLHNKLAIKLFCELAGTDAIKWAEGAQTINDSIRARIALWDAVIG
jgi:hypothetical protein